MEALWQQGTLALHTFITNSEFNLGKGKAVTQMQASVHVGIWHAGHVFWKCFVEILAIGMFFDGRRIHFERLDFVPVRACLALELTKSITFERLPEDVGS